MIRFILPFAFLLNSLSATQAAAAPAGARTPHLPSFQCPAALRVSTHFGVLKIDELTDGSYASVSGSQFQADFVRDPNTRECVLVEQLPSLGTQRFLGIKKDRKGNLLAFLEGYTPNGKLFSIRIALDPARPVEGVFLGTVYDTSGTRRVLGEAQVTFVNLALR